MKINSIGLSILILSALLITGCRSNPVYNVTDAPITTAQRTLSERDIAKAIITAGNTLKWIMQEKDDGHIQGTLFLRTHMAAVDIYYDTEKFSIKYNDSNNLKYDGTSIHKQYNNWVRNLNREINLQISKL